MKTHTALSVLVEVGDFKRFASAQHFASYLGLVPGDDSSGDDPEQTRNYQSRKQACTATPNRSVTMLCKRTGWFQIQRTEVPSVRNTPAVIAYADKANERLRRRYYKMVLNKYKKHNVAKTAIARELACFMWGMMTDNIA